MVPASLTALIGGAVVFVAAALVALLFGWGQGDNGILLLSIGSTVVAGVLLTVAYVLTKLEARRGPREDSPEAAQDVAPEASGDGEAGERETPAAATDEGASSPGGAEAEVIAYPARKRFHRPDCRYADRPGGRTMTRAAADADGFMPCGVCKP